MVVCNSALQWHVSLCVSLSTILNKRVNFSLLLITSLTVAVFERTSVEYTKRISSLSATHFKVEKFDFE